MIIEQRPPFRFIALRLQLLAIVEWAVRVVRYRREGVAVRILEKPVRRPCRAYVGAHWRW